MNRILSITLALLLAAPGVVARATAQTAAPAGPSQLRLVVVDQTGAGIPGATIIVTPQGATAGLTVTSDERGLATLTDLPLGVVNVHVEFPGFLPTDQPVTLRRGANNQNVELKIEGFQEEVVVTDTTATDDRRGNSMSTTLEESEIETLPDDPDQLAEVLTQMAGGAGAIFQVNGFRGGRLPSRDEIRQIRFRTNSFSADNHDAGRTQIEIITRPNVREWSGNANMQYRSDAMNARNAFSREETPELNRQFNMGLRGPIVANKTSIRFNVDGRRDAQADTIFALDEFENQISQFVRRPNESTNVTVGVEHAVNNNQTLRMEVRGGVNASENNGVGGFNLMSRATSREGSNYQIRAQLQGVVGKNALNEIRLQYNGSRSETSSASNDPAIVVQEAFTRGGAGADSWNSNRQFELADNFDFNVGRKQQMRVGFLLEGGQYNYFDQSGANGTFTFRSLADFNAGLPATYRVREGQVQTDFSVYQLGFYWQDDYRVNNKFSFSLGVRNEMQSLIDDKLNLMPRLGFTYTPAQGTNIRGGYGLFYDWYESSLYDQTLRLNGVAQSETLIFNPGYPDPYVGALPSAIQPGGRTQAAPDLKMPYVHQASLGIERNIGQNLSTQVTYQMLRGRNQFRALNLNQPVPTVVGIDGAGNELVSWVRPDATVGNVIQFDSTGRSNTDRLTFNVNYRIPQRQIFFGGNYTLGQVLSHSDGATSLPMDSNDRDAEWGPSRQDVRHRFQAMFNVPLAFGFRFNTNVNGQSASPYNVTTGLDANNDGVFNDRPAGVGRNAARGRAMWTMNVRIMKQFALGGPRDGGGFPGGFPGGRPAGAVSQQRGQGGGGNRGGGNNPFNARYSMDFYISADNVLNNVNYTGFSGNMLSPLFGQPTAAQPARRLQVGMGFRF